MTLADRIADRWPALAIAILIAGMLAGYALRGHIDRRRITIHPWLDEWVVLLGRAVVGTFPDREAAARQKQRLNTALKGRRT